MDTIWPKGLLDAGGPKYKQVAATIRTAVELGTLTEGAKLPPVRDLAFRLGITPGTVARAYTVLTDEGVLQAEVGRGTFVAATKTSILDDVWSRIPDAADTGVINLFSPRLPDMGQVAVMRRAMAQVAQAQAADFLSYPTRDAYLPVRQAVIHWMSDVPLGALDEKDVVLSHGGQNGITLVLQAVLKGPKPVVLVEDLSYAGFRRASELLRADVVGLPMDKDGILPDALDAAARSTGAQIFCTSPEVQNPTCGHTPIERRLELVAVARKHGLQILEDDCYRMGEPRGPSYRSLAPQQGWHVSSISKTLTPALRVGFAIAPQGRGADLRRVAEYGFFGLARPLAEMTRILLSDPETPKITKAVRLRMAEYVRVAVNALGGYDLTWDEEVPFVWLQLPQGWRSAAFCRAAEAEGIQIRSADEFALRDGRAPHAVRIAINAHVSLAVFEDAMMRLRELLGNPPEQISV